MRKISYLIWSVFLFLLADRCFAQARRVSFPHGFRWCIATAAHQIEGSNDKSDWWQWEQQPGHIDKGDKSGIANDHWNRIEEDTKLLEYLGVDTYRFSVEWAKIEPRENHYDLEVIQHYRDEVDLLLAKGIEPMITLVHYTLPQWISEKGGWEWDGVVEAFERFTEMVFRGIGPNKVRFWVTFNEPMGILMGGYSVGLTPPGFKRNLNLEKPLTNMLAGHAAAYHVLQSLARESGQDVQIGIAEHLRIYQAWNPLDPLASALARKTAEIGNWTFLMAAETGIVKLSVPFKVNIHKELPGLKGTQDFIGINYYRRSVVQYMAKPPFIDIEGPGSNPVADNGWEIYPEGIAQVIEETSRRFPAKHQFITENGIADKTADDDRRTQYLKDHLMHVSRMIEQGHPVVGYCFWTLADNFEWLDGYKTCFGLCETDRTTLTRRPRRSAETFRSIVAANGFSLP
ncbi:MAG: family 1 glycosylhydrolase [Deltaproteobacteria bacterium]|nr:family 1 glycosylhydrolase [Deltaproteobacteria bacterium]